MCIKINYTIKSNRNIVLYTMKDVIWLEFSDHIRHVIQRMGGGGRRPSCVIIGTPMDQSIGVTDCKLERAVSPSSLLQTTKSTFLQWLQYNVPKRNRSYLYFIYLFSIHLKKINLRVKKVQ